MTPLTISSLKQQTGETPLSAAVLAQLESCLQRSTKHGKPYLELTFSDATGNASIKLWENSPVFAEANQMKPGEVIRLEAKWVSDKFGLEAKDLALAKPDPSSLDDFFRGDPELRDKQNADFGVIQSLCASIRDPRLHTLCGHFLDQMGDRFRRTAAAKKNHHARRGGLVEHVAQMMRSAEALCPVYPELNRDLLLTGVLFHDCGKLWENSYPEHGFAQTLTVHGEMMGHIPLGIELVNKLWRELTESEAHASWTELTPPNDLVRLHLLHLIGSHHGEYEFGSPVLPRTPEAFALHFIDNLDAKMEMVRQGYANSPEIAPQIQDRAFPLPANLVKPLPEFES